MYYTNHIKNKSADFTHMYNSVGLTSLKPNVFLASKKL